MNNENEVNRSIIENSYYIINHFETSETEITNLKLQKLLYLAEALYMSIYKNETKLFNEEWIASESEPINNELNLKFNEFGNNIIDISDEEKNSRIARGLCSTFPAQSRYQTSHHSS